ncbi:MAG: type III secretion inner membrane ring lipoprotein SctJ, partial [Simkaniaceae bacterium]|nr:type III secretion inner membrane ring lipoprotein SctJ [Simkaniaceae bacterium]
MKYRLLSLLLIALLLFTGCQSNQSIVTGVDEKEANLIVVFLESKGISAEKTLVAVSGAGAATDTGPKFNIVVPQAKAIDAMSILNRNGLPRKQGTNLLTLFAKQGLMTSQKEETVRYQAGLAQQITNTIMLMDGVLDASVQLSFPPEELSPNEAKQKITAAVYVKHQGIVDDPSSHLENKIKRLVSGSITGLDINDVTVVADRSRLTEATPMDINAEMAGRGSNDYVSIWSIVMSKSSAAKFRTI